MNPTLKTAIDTHPIRTMRRYELIQRIAAIAHPATFDRILYWPTDMLRLYILDHELEQGR